MNDAFNHMDDVTFEAGMLESRSIKP